MEVERFRALRGVCRVYGGLVRFRTVWKLRGFKDISDAGRVYAIEGVKQIRSVDGD